MEWKGTSDGAEQARNDQLLEEISTLVPLLVGWMKAQCATFSKGISRLRGWCWPLKLPCHFPSTKKAALEELAAQWLGLKLSSGSWEGLEPMASCEKSSRMKLLILAVFVCFCHILSFVCHLFVIVFECI